MILKRILLGCLPLSVFLFNLSDQQPGAVAHRITNRAIVPTSRNEGWWIERHGQKLGRVRQGACDLLFLGDSIMHNYEKPGPAPDEVFSPTWEFFYTARRAINLGYSGDETENLLWRLDHGEVDGIEPKVTVILIGTNNTNNHPEWTSPQTVEGIETVVAEVHRRLPRTKVLLLGILPTDLGPAKTAIDQAINLNLAKDYAGNHFVTILDIAQTFFKDGTLDTTLFYDTRLKPARGALHPDSKGQALMAAAIEPTLSKLLGDANRLTFHPNPLDPPEQEPKKP